MIVCEKFYENYGETPSMWKFPENVKEVSEYEIENWNFCMIWKNFLINLFC